MFFPVWLGFKGGKGVAVFIGTSIVLSPLPGLSMLSVWLLVALIGRRSSLAALIATLSVAPYMFVLGEVYGAVVVGVQVGVIYWAHRENISRLRKGQEPRIGQSGKRTINAKFLHQTVCAITGRAMTEHKMTGKLSEADILAYMRLSRTEKLGPVPIRIDDLVEQAEAPL